MSTNIGERTGGRGQRSGGWILRALWLCLVALGAVAGADERSVEIGARVRVIRSPLYVATIDLDRRMLREIHYTIRREDLAAGRETVRDFYTPEELREECLESADYAGSDFDQGHTRALLLSRGSEHWRDVNCMAVIVPQAHKLNQQTIRFLEAHIGELVQQHGRADVVVECLFREPLPPLPKADEPHTVPAAFWYQIEAGTEREAYQFPNRGDVAADPQRYRVW